MPKYSYVDQGVQGANIYRQAKREGNQQMMQNGLQMIAQATNALRGITDVQAARQTMQFRKEINPLLVGQQEAVTGQAQIDLQKAQKLQEAYATLAEKTGRSIEEVQAHADLLETQARIPEATRKGMVAEGGVATERERQRGGYYPAVAGAERAEVTERRELAVTGAERAVAQRPYIQAEAEAAGAKAEYEKLSALADISNMPAEEITRRSEIESREWRARLDKGVAVNEMDYIASDKQRSIELIKEQINTLKKRGQLYDAQILEAQLKLQTDDMAVLKEIRALASDIQSAYMALARLEAGEDVLEQLAKIGSASGMKMNLTAMGADAGDREALKQNIIAHISILRSLINRHGYQYDNTSIPPTFRTLSPSERRMPPGGGATVQYEQYRKDLPPSAQQTYQEPKQTAPLGPPSPGATDVDTLLDAFGL